MFEACTELDKKKRHPELPSTSADVASWLFLRLQSNPGAFKHWSFAMLQLLLLLEAAPNCHVNDHGCYHRNYYHGISLQLRLLFLPLCPFCCCICPFAAVSATTTTTAQPTPATTTTTASRTAAPPTMVAFKATSVSLFTLGIFAMSARGGVVKYRALLASRRRCFSHEKSPGRPQTMAPRRRAGPEEEEDEEDAFGSAGSHISESEPSEDEKEKETKPSKTSQAADSAKKEEVSEEAEEVGAEAPEDTQAEAQPEEAKEAQEGEEPQEPKEAQAEEAEEDKEVKEAKEARRKAKKAKKKAKEADEAEEEEAYEEVDEDADDADGEAVQRRAAKDGYEESRYKAGFAGVGQRPEKKWLHSGDVKKGQRLRGTVIEILDSHARLDVGLDTMATLHASKILPEGAMLQEELSIGQEMEVWVCGARPLSYKVKQGTTWRIDARLEVTMLNPAQLSSDVTEFAQLPPNALLAATVTHIEPYGIVVKVKSPTGAVPVQGFVHVSEIRDGYVEHPADEVDVGQDITVSIVRIDEKFGRLRLTMKLPEVEVQVPRDNRYFLHDDRQADDEGKEEDDEEKKEDKKEKREERRGDKPSPDDEGKWLHDKYFELLEEKPRAKAPLGWSRGQDGDHGDWYSSDSRQGRARTLKTWMPKMPESKDQWEEDWEDDNKWRGKKWTSEKYDSYDRYDKRDKGKSGKNSKYDDYDEYDASESWERDRKGGSNGKDAWSGWSAGGGKSSGKGRRREEEWEDEEEWHDDRWHASSSKNGYSNGRSKGGHSRRDEGDDWDKKRGYDDYDYDYDYEELARATF
ncbi:rpsA [Symbiodinium microadriaticum]|nr:rpsA [Symbiodinium microadriaticum]